MGNGGSKTGRNDHRQTICGADLQVMPRIYVDGSGSDCDVEVQRSSVKAIPLMMGTVGLQLLQHCSSGVRRPVPAATVMQDPRKPKRRVLDAERQ